jgi:fucose permease
LAERAERPVEIRTHPERDALTLLCFGAVAAFGFLSNGLGPILPFLQAELSIGRGQAGTFSLILAIGLLAIGLIGHEVVRRIGRRATFWLGVSAVISGPLILTATDSLLVASFGVALLGAGGAMLVFLVPAIMADRHGHLATRAIVESTAVISASAILAPLLVAGAVTLGLGWRLGYIALPLAVTAILVVVGRRIRFEGDHLVPVTPILAGVAIERPGGSFRRRWLDVLTVVSIEICMVFWSADYLVSVFGLDRAIAAAIVSLFFIGMAVGRGAGGRLAGSGTSFLSALVVTAVGFAIFWFAPIPVVAGVGLLTTGLAVALLYPLSISRALAAWPSDPDRASARGALASGLAFGIAPFALGLVAERADLRTAFLIVPALLVIVLANTMVPGRASAAAIEMSPG